MDSFLNSRLGGAVTVAKRSPSSSVWYLLFIGVVAFGIYMLFGRKKQQHGGAGGQQGGYGRRPAAVNTFGRAGATNMMQQIMQERSGFQQPEPYYSENDTGEETGPKSAMVHFASPLASQMGGMGGIGGDSGGSSAASSCPVDLPPPVHTGGGNVVVPGGTAADQLAGMPSLARTDARQIDFAALRQQLGKGKKGG
jgi:hypothetical protein